MKELYGIAIKDFILYKRQKIAFFLFYYKKKMLQ